MEERDKLHEFFYDKVKLELAATGKSNTLDNILFEYLDKDDVIEIFEKELKEIAKSNGE